ncbi:DegV family protein [Proteinivorax tanatarense]|uniref:DegV family protein n=1 Tax=Proteinivorax tanatarense TaxID=1260629 RepID=A0AAU7VQD4_9FIRM
MTSTVVVTDSSADLPDGVLKELDIIVIPLKIKINSNVYKDNIGISADEIFKNVKEDTPKITVNEPDVNEIQDIYINLLSKYQNIISIHSDTVFCGVANKVKGAKESFANNKVSVVETNLFSMALGCLAMEVGKVAKSCNKKTKLVSLANNLKNNMLTYFLVEGSDTLNSKLYKELEEHNEDVVNTNYIIIIKNGKIEVVDCYKNRPKALAGLAKLAQERFLGSTKYKVAISYGECLGDALQLRESLEKEKEYNELILSQMGATNGAHLGPKAVVLTTYPV